MKKLLILLFSLFFFSSPSVIADDISDFQIEGIKIGDSLLDYMTKDKILEKIESNKEMFPWLNEPNKYAQISLGKDFPVYVDGVSVLIKNNSTNKYLTDINEKYTILFVGGRIPYNEDFDGCIKERDQITKIFSGMFPNAKKTESFFNHSVDPSGNSIVDGVYFDFDSGADIDAYCTNFDETFRNKKNWSEGLNVSISSAETTSWMRDYK